MKRPYLRLELDDQGIYAFKRTLADAEYWVILNNSNETRKLSFANGQDRQVQSLFGAAVVASNKQIKTTLPPYSGSIIQFLPD